MQSKIEKYRISLITYYTCHLYYYACCFLEIANTKVKRFYLSLSDNVTQK